MTKKIRSGLTTKNQGKGRENVRREDRVNVQLADRLVEGHPVRRVWERQVQRQEQELGDAVKAQVSNCQIRK